VFNVFNHESALGPDGFNTEERKLVSESRKILRRPDLQVEATCVRVPVFRAHSEALFVQTKRPITPARARALLSKAEGVEVIDDRKRGKFPTPLQASGKDPVFAGRFRQGATKKDLCLFVSGDQIRKGAALNAVQIAEHLL